MLNLFFRLTDLFSHGGSATMRSKPSESATVSNKTTKKLLRKYYP